ncbi:MAG: oligosaccharide flippase family protein [Oscillospiraceae bacterium]
MKSNSPKLRYNIFFQLLNELLTIVTPLITTPYISRCLGPVEIGRFSYARSIAYYFVVFASLGINVYGSRQIASVKDDPEKLNSTFSNLFYIVCGSSLVSVVIYITGVLGGFINRNDSLMSLVMVFYILSSTLNVRWLFQGLEHFNITVIRSVIVKVIVVILVFLTVHSSNDTLIYALLFAGVSNFLSELTLFILAPRYVKFRAPDMNTIAKNLKPLLIMFIPYAANLMLRHIDKVMLGSLNTLEQVGFYENTDKIYMMLVVFNTALGDVLLPRETNLLAKGDESAAKELMNYTIRINMILSVAFAFGISSVADNFVPIFLGDRFNPCVLLLKMIAPTIVLLAFSAMIRKTYILPHYMTKLFILTTLSALLTNIVFNAILIPKYDAIGAVIATVISELLVVLIQFIALRKHICYKIFLKDLIVFSIIGAVMYGGVRLISFIPLSGVIMLCLQILTGAVIYMGLSVLWLKISKDMLYTIAISRLKKHRNKA